MYEERVHRIIAKVLYIFLEKVLNKILQYLLLK